jgi:predicted nucleotidyltransferase
MNTDRILNTIKSTVHDYLPDARVLLFGSHARGDFKKDSDYDIMVITPNRLTKEQKDDCYGKLDKSLVSSIHAPVDLILYCEEDIEIRKELPGHIVKTVLKEGIAL